MPLTEAKRSVTAGKVSVVSLVIDLQEGFDCTPVAITLDGREVFRKEGVRTRMQIGLADRIELDVAPGEHRVQISLPDKGIQAEATVDAAETPYLGVSVEREALILGPAAEPYRYA